MPLLVLTIDIAQTLPSVYGAPVLVVVEELVVLVLALLALAGLLALVELAGLRTLAGLLVWAKQRLLVLTRVAAAINSLREVFINEVFL